MKKMIEDNAMGLATINVDNTPNNIAIGYVKVIEKNKLLISNNYLKTTVENIKRNSNVSIVVWPADWKKNYIGYELKGKAEYFTEGKYCEMIKKLPINKGEPSRGAIVVTINNVKVLG